MPVVITVRRQCKNSAQVSIIGKGGENGINGLLFGLPVMAVPKVNFHRENIAHDTSIATSVATSVICAFASGNHGPGEVFPVHKACQQDTCNMGQHQSQRDIG
jgi:hypothetical protein